MEEKLSAVAKKSSSSPIQELSHLAQRCNAINLAEGYPDFPAPTHLKNAAISAINSDFNQYRHVQELCDLLAEMTKKMHGLSINPMTDIAICCGQTESFAAAVFAVIDPGDEVILFDPCYETYEGCILMAGGVPVYVDLDPPRWNLDPEKLTKAFTARTKAVVLNSPHNPTGKVFSKDELEVIAGACRRKDCLAITDEVYEHIVFDNEKHISIASLPGMQGRTIITSSLSKTFSVTGWRVGWAIAPSCFASAIRNIHIKVTDSAPAPFQEAAMAALRSPPEYFQSLKRDYESKRDYIVQSLLSVGFKIQFMPQGSIFLFAELPESSFLSDVGASLSFRSISNGIFPEFGLFQVEYVKELIKQARVVAVPGCGFFHASKLSEKSSPVSYGYRSRYIRFAFCKSYDTLIAAEQQLAGILDNTGRFKLQ